MFIPTEPIGSIPRPLPLIEAVINGNGEDPNLDPLYEAAVRDTIAPLLLAQKTGRGHCMPASWSMCQSPWNRPSSWRP
jgi:hypothetical protein